MSWLRRLRRRMPPSRAEAAALAARVDEQRALLASLVASVEAQAKELKKLNKTLAERDQRWQTTVDRMVKHHAAEARDVATRQRRADASFREAMERHAGHQQREAKWRTSFARQLSAVIRRLYLPADLPYPYRLAAKRFGLRSQFDEDGLILAILEEAGVVTRRFVEIGCGRSGGSSSSLALDCGWGGLMIDASQQAIDQARQRFAFNPEVTVHCSAVYPENVNEILTAQGYTGEVDVLSIDIDSYDYWVLDALTVTSPRLLVTEYNAAWGPTRAVTIPYPEPRAGRPKGYYGASLTALTRAAARKGYRLVICDDSGANAFFLRNDVAPHIPAMPVERAYRRLMSRVDFGELAADRNIYRLVEEHGLRIVDV